MAGTIRLLAVVLVIGVAACGGGGAVCVDSFDCAFGLACRDAKCVVVNCTSVPGCLSEVEICVDFSSATASGSNFLCTAPCSVFHRCPAGLACHDQACKDADVNEFDASDETVDVDIVDGPDEGIDLDRYELEVVDVPGTDDGIMTDGVWIDLVDLDVFSPDTIGMDAVEPDTFVPDVIAPDTVEADMIGMDAVEPDTFVPDLIDDDSVVQDISGGDGWIPFDTSDPPACFPMQNIANLLTQAEGTVDVMICGAVVTKVTSKGWYITDDSTTRGMYIYEGPNPDWGYEVEVGDYVQMHVTAYGSYQGTQQVSGKENVTIQGKADHREYIVDLSEGTVPGESIESRVVRIDDVKVTSAAGKSGTIDYGTATNVPVFVEYNDIACIGLEADVVAGVVTQFNSVHQINLTDHADLANVSLANCEAPPEYDMSNWDFEKQSVEEDPPEGFTKGVGNTFTCVRDEDGGNNGSAGIVLTWTSTDNQDLAQGYKFPTTSGSTVMFGVDVLDNDSAGKVRQGLNYYDVDKQFISSSWSSDFSADSAEWQRLSYQAVAPSGAAFAEAKLRMYDSQSPDGTWGNPTASATVTIDNWEMVSVEP